MPLRNDADGRLPMRRSTTPAVIHANARATSTPLVEPVCGSSASSGAPLTTSGDGAAWATAGTVTADGAASAELAAGSASVDSIVTPAATSAGSSIVGGIAATAFVGAGAAAHAVGRSTVEAAETVDPDSRSVATASRSRDRLVQRLDLLEHDGFSDRPRVARAGRAVETPCLAGRVAGDAHVPARHPCVGAAAIGGCFDADRCRLCRAGSDAHTEYADGDRRRGSEGPPDTRRRPMPALHVSPPARRPPHADHST